MKRYIKSSRLSHDVDEYQEWIDYDMKHYGRISKQTMDDIKKAGFTVTRDQYGDYEVTAAEDIKCSQSPSDFYKVSKNTWGTTDLKYAIKLNKNNKYEVYKQTSNAPDYDFLTTKLYFDTLEEAEDYILQNFYGADIESAKNIKCSHLSHDFDEYQKWIDYDMKRYGRVSAETRRKIRDAGFTITRDQYGDYEVTACDDIKADTVKKGNKWVNRGDTGKEHGEFDTKKEADAQRRAMYAGGWQGGK